MTWNPFDPTKSGEYNSWLNHREKYSDSGLFGGSTYEPYQPKKSSWDTSIFSYNPEPKKFSAAEQIGSLIESLFK